MEVFGLLKNFWKLKPEIKVRMTMEEIVIQTLRMLKMDY
jgi:hypothetical protein